MPAINCGRGLSIADRIRHSQHFEAVLSERHDSAEDILHGCRSRGLQSRLRRLQEAASAFRTISRPQHPMQAVGSELLRR